MVARPVFETQEREERYMVQRAVYETSEREECYNVAEPVTTYSPVTVDQGGYVYQTVCRPGPVYNRLAWVPGGCVVNPATGQSGYQFGGLAWVPMQGAGRTEVLRVWQPNPVTVQVPQTSLVQRQVTRRVPVQTCGWSMKKSSARCRYRFAGWCKKKRSARCRCTSAEVTEHVDNKVPVTVCRMVPEEVVRKVPVTTYRVRTKSGLNSSRCRFAGWWPRPRRCAFPRQLVKKVPVVYTYRVPRTVIYKVPVDPCGNDLVMAETVVPRPRARFTRRAPPGCRASRRFPARLSPHLLRRTGKTTLRARGTPHESPATRSERSRSRSGRFEHYAADEAERLAAPARRGRTAGDDQEHGKSAVQRY